MQQNFVIGIGVGALTGLWMWCEYWLGLHTTQVELGRYTGAFSVVIPVFGIVFALRRARRLAGGLTYADAMRCGTVLSVGAALSMAIMSAIYSVLLHPEWASAPGGSAPGALVTQASLGALVGGIVITAVAGLVMRTRTRAARDRAARVEGSS